MSTPFTHAVVALAAGKTFMTGKMPARFWLLAALCAVLPDVDGLAFSLGIPYEHVLGHRGLSHSLPFALLVSAAVVGLGFRNVPRLSRRWWGLWAFFFLVAASHGVLDAMTDGGLGVAFFAPFSSARYFLPWRPLPVSPIGLPAFLSRWGLEVILSEILWIWIPAIVLVLLVGVCRRAAGGRARPSAVEAGKQRQGTAA